MKKNKNRTLTHQSDCGGGGDESNRGCEREIMMIRWIERDDDATNWDIWFWGLNIEIFWKSGVRKREMRGERNRDERWEKEDDFWESMSVG